MTSAPALLAHNLSYSVGGRSLISQVSLQVQAGEVLAVLGPSGAGKSTLLHLLGALVSPQQGELYWGGEAVRAQQVSRAAALRAERVGLVFQHHYLLGDLSVLGNVALPGLVLRRDATAPARELLAQVGLAGREDARPGDLSGGERQRVAIARALVMRPHVLLADEPTGSLDQKAAAQVSDLMFALARERGCGVVLATHAGELAARSDRKLTLLDGRVQRDDP